MDYSQAKEALKRICQLPDNRKNKEVNKIIYEHPSLINEVLDFEGSTALILATKNNNIEVIKLLLSQENLDINIQNKYGSTALHCASGNGHKDIVEVLLSKDNIDINIQHKYGGTALHVASHYDHKEVVELLLSQDNIDINIQEIDGETALHRASRYGHKDILELLLSKDNIFINKKRRGGETALHLASRNGHKDIVEVLLSQDNIDINARNTCGWTALHLASHYGHRNIVEGLLSKDNADINLQDKDGKLTIKRCYDRCERSSANNSTKRPDEAFSIKFQVEEARDGDEVKERELLTVVEENKSLKLQVQSLEEITNNTRELEKKLQGKEESMKLTVNNLVTRLVAEKEKEYDELRGQIGRMETLLNQMENCKKELERKLEEKEKVLMLKPFPLPPNKQTHVFLTHTWRDDEKGRNNHDRVGRVNQALRERGLVTWFDSERMVGTVRQDMTNALGDACCVLIFITKKYEEKVNSADEADNCYFEFNVAAHDKNLANMRIPIVMEECMLSLESWQDRGRLKAEMGHKIYFDLSSDEGGVLEIQHDKIVERVVELLRERFPVVSFA